MNHQIREVPLGAAGLAYLRESLGDSKQLARSLLGCLNLEQGTARTFLPLESSDQHIYDFRRGGKVMGPASPLSSSSQGRGITRIFNMDSVLVDIIQTHLDSGWNSFCLVEAPLAHADDPKSTEGTVLVHDDSVFYLLEPDKTNQAAIQQTLRVASSIWPPTVGALGRGARRTAHLEIVDIKALEEFAEKTESIFVSAYDGEGFVLWSRGARAAERVPRRLGA